MFQAGFSSNFNEKSSLTQVAIKIIDLQFSFGCLKRWFLGIFTFWYRYTLFPITKSLLNTSRETSERNEISAILPISYRKFVTIRESKDTIAVLSKSLFKRSKLPKINEIFITTCVKETFHLEISPNPTATKYLLRLKRLFVKITKSSLLLVLPIKQTFDQNYTCSCVMKLCLTTTNGILETPIRTF